MCDSGGIWIGIGIGISSVFVLFENMILLTLTEDLLTVSVSDVAGLSEIWEVDGVGSLEVAGPHLTLRTLAFREVFSSSCGGWGSITASFDALFGMIFFTVFFDVGFGSKVVDFVDDFSGSLLSI